MTLSEVKTALIALLQTEFPPEDMNYYSMAVVEGYERPCFFTQIQPVEMEPANYNTRKTTVAFYINYRQSEVDEEDIYDVIDRIRDIFGLSVTIEDRAAKVDSFDYEFVGTDRNIPEISVTLSWYDRIDHTENYELMETLEINEVLEG